MDYEQSTAQTSGGRNALICSSSARTRSIVGTEMTAVGNNASGKSHEEEGIFRTSGRMGEGGSKQQLRRAPIGPLRMKLSATSSQRCASPRLIGHAFVPPVARHCTTASVFALLLSHRSPPLIITRLVFLRSTACSAS